MRVSLDIPPGIVTDDTVFSAEGAWADCDKVRFWRGKAQVIGGWEKFLQDQLLDICRTTFPWTDNTDNLVVAYGQTSALQISYGGAVYDITPTTFVPGNENGTGGAGYGTGLYGGGAYGEPSDDDTFPMTWSFGTYGESLMANPRGQTIFWWQNDTGTLAAPLTNAPAEVTFTLVAPTRQVMAFGCNEEISGDFNPLCIRFSDIEDPEVWETLPSNNAGEVILEGGGRIVAARLIGSYIFVWTNHSLFLGTFTGDNTQPWVFNRQGEHCGLIGPNAAAVKDQQAFWMSTDGQFRQCVLGGAPDIIVSPVAQEVKDNLPITQVDKIVASTCSQFGEIRWDYPDSRDDDGRAVRLVDGAGNFIVDGEGDYIIIAPQQDAGVENSRYVALSTIDGTWCRGHMARTSYVDAGPNQYPIATDPDGNVYIHERGASADGGAFDWYIESADQYIADGEPFLTLRGMWPDFKDQAGPVFMTIYGRKYPQGQVYTKGPYSLAPDQEQRAFMMSCRVIRIKMAGNSTPTYARFGKIVFDTVPAGIQ
jgi:hypothetical protein